jgi:replicative DNA helicase
MSTETVETTEKAVLGCIMLDNPHYDEAAESLGAEDFSLDSHRRIYSRMGTMRGDDRAIDIITLQNELVRHNELDGIGGSAYLASLTEGLPRRPSITDYIRDVKTASRRRRLLKLGETVTAGAADPTQDLEQLVGHTDSSLLELSDPGKSEDRRASSHIVQLLDTMQKEKARKGDLLGLPLGNPTLDLVTRGGQPGNVIVVGAKSGDGKTSAMAAAACAIASSGVPAMLFSLEMRTDEILRRIFSIVSGVPFIRIRDPKWASSDDMDAVKYAAEKVADWPLWIDQDSGIHIDQLVARAKLAIRRHGVKFIGVDYCQIVRADGREERHRVAAVSRALTQLAKNEGVVVMLLSQLSRQERGTTVRRPRMSDLRESSQLENDAHVVALLHRIAGDDGNAGTEAELIIAKNRNGAVGTFPMTFNQATLTFEPSHAAARQARAS